MFVVVFSLRKARETVGKCAASTLKWQETKNGVYSKA